MSFRGKAPPSPLTAVPTVEDKKHAVGAIQNPHQLAVQTNGQIIIFTCEGNDARTYITSFNQLELETHPKAYRLPPNTSATIQSNGNVVFSGGTLPPNAYFVVNTQQAVFGYVRAHPMPMAPTVKFDHAIFGKHQRAYGIYLLEDGCVRICSEHGPFKLFTNIIPKPSLSTASVFFQGNIPRVLYLAPSPKDGQISLFIVSFTIDDGATSETIQYHSTKEWDRKNVAEFAVNYDGMLTFTQKGDVHDLYIAHFGDVDDMPKMEHQIHIGYPTQLKEVRKLLFIWTYTKPDGIIMDIIINNDRETILNHKRQLGTIPHFIFIKYSKDTGNTFSNASNFLNDVQESTFLDKHVHNLETDLDVVMLFSKSCWQNNHFQLRQQLHNNGVQDNVLIIQQAVTDGMQKQLAKEKKENQKEVAALHQKVQVLAKQANADQIALKLATDVKRVPLSQKLNKTHAAKCGELQRRNDTLLNEARIKDDNARKEQAEQVKAMAKIQAELDAANCQIKKMEEEYQRALKSKQADLDAATEAQHASSATTSSASALMVHAPIDGALFNLIHIQNVKMGYAYDQLSFMRDYLLQACFNDGYILDLLHHIIFHLEMPYRAFDMPI